MRRGAGMSRARAPTRSWSAPAPAAPRSRPSSPPAGWASSCSRRARATTTARFTARPRDMIPRLYRDAGQLATIGTPPIVLPLGRARRRHDARQLGHLLPHARARARALGARRRRAPRCADELFDYVEESIGVAEVPEALAGRNALLVKRGAEALGLSGGFLRRNAPRLRRLGRLRVRLPDRRQAARRRRAGCRAPRRPARGVLTGVQGARACSSSTAARARSACRRAG